MFTFFFGGLGTRLTVNLTVSSAVEDYDLFVEAGSPVNPVDVILTVEAAGSISASSTGVAGFDTGTGWPAASTLQIINKGNIYGKGGAGGVGASIVCPSCGAAATAGEAAGNALNLQHDITIDNFLGNIFGGGGGGGGGGGVFDSPGASAYAGSGGGGGQTGGTSSGGNGGTAISCNFVNLNGNPGGDGSVSAAGTGGARVGTATYKGGYGGGGGGWGDAGSAGGTAIASGGLEVYCSPNSGGAAGKAVDLNGNSITWLGGNNSTQVKGAVS